MKTCSISDGSRNCDDRSADKSSNHTGKSTFHSGYCHNAVCTLNQIQLGKQSVHATNTDIINALNSCPEVFCGLCSLLRHRNISSSCAADCDFSRPYFILFLNLDDTGNRIILRLRKLLFNQLILLLAGSCSKNFPIFSVKPLEDLQKMFIRLSAAINDFCKPRSLFAADVQLGIFHLVITFLF